MKIFLTTIILTLLLLLPLQIKANPKVLGFGQLFFGEEETVVAIQDLQDSKYTLCHKYTSHYYLAGIYLTDDGYVLQVKGNEFSYFPLDKAKIAELQQNKTLPESLPSYSIPISAYIFGYSLWWSILILACFLFFLFRGFEKDK